MVTAVVTAVAVVVAVAGLAGCSGSDPAPAPTTLHPGTAATPTTRTPTSDPTDLAAAAAIAAVQKLYAELNTAIHTGRTAEYAKTFTKECQTCVGDQRTTMRIYANGSRLVGGTYQVTDLAVVWNKVDLIIVQGLLAADPLAVRKGSRVVERDPALRRVSFTWKVKPVHGAWLVTEVHALR